MGTRTPPSAPEAARWVPGLSDSLTTQQLLARRRQPRKSSRPPRPPQLREPFQDHTALLSARLHPAALLLWRALTRRGLHRGQLVPTVSKNSPASGHSMSALCCEPTWSPWPSLMVRIYPTGHVGRLCEPHPPHSSGRPPPHSGQPCVHAPARAAWWQGEEAARQGTERGSPHMLFIGKLGLKTPHIPP